MQSYLKDSSPSCFSWPPAEYLFGSTRCSAQSTAGSKPRIISSLALLLGLQGFSRFVDVVIRIGFLVGLTVNSCFLVGLFGFRFFIQFAIRKSSLSLFKTKFQGLSHYLKNFINFISNFLIVLKYYLLKSLYIFNNFQKTVLLFY